jgi:hypothetical protein
MFKAFCALVFLFSFSAFAGKDPNLIDPSVRAKKAAKYRGTDRPFAKPTAKGAPIAVNTAHGFKTVKNELHESPQQVKAKWNGFTPQRMDDAKPVMRKTASAKKTEKKKTVKK